MKKVLSLLTAIVFIFTMLTACGTPAADDKPGSSAPAAGAQTSSSAPAKDATVFFFNMKVEIADALAKMIPEFEKENPGIKVKLETVGGGADYGAALMAKFQSGDAPDIFNCTGFADLTKWLDKCADLTDQPWVSDMVAGANIPIERDGKIYGLPLAVEGFGFAYNKDLFAKAGITTLPNTLATLEEACEKLQAAGITPFSNSYAEWWVLGLHNINVILSQQPDPQKFIDDIAAGNASIKNTPVTAGWTKLLDLTVKYGQKNATTAGDYATSVANFSSGKAAMIQQGNWIQPDLDKVDENLNVGFLPMPIGDTPEDKINAGIPNYLSVRKDSKVLEQTKTFLNWMVSSDTGRRYLTDELKCIPAFKSIKSSTFKGLNAALIEYTSQGRTYPWVFPRLPDGAGQLIGDAMMKYLGGQSTADEMYAAIDKAIADKATATK
jgi:raffinose/stachyose/melibiose transport system substrate-binding protein